jgi:hypothetical protein
VVQVYQLVKVLAEQFLLFLQYYLLAAVLVAIN